MDQLTLAFDLRPEHDFAGFVAGPNAEAKQAMEDMAGADAWSYLYLYGPASSGKTHLLQAACVAAVERCHTIQYLPLGVPGMHPDALANLEQIELVALDDLDAVAGDADWEQALFRLYNELKDCSGRLLVSADRPLAELPIALPDLRSRLGAGAGYHLEPLDDEASAELLNAQAAARGMPLGADLIGYILRRSRRDAGSLIRLVQRIDEVTLKRKRAPSMRLVSELLDEQK